MNQAVKKKRISLSVYNDHIAAPVVFAISILIGYVERINQSTARGEGHAVATAIEAEEFNQVLNAFTSMKLFKENNPINNIFTNSLNSLIKIHKDFETEKNLINEQKTIYLNAKTLTRE